MDCVNNEENSLCKYEGPHTEHVGALKMCVWSHGENKQLSDLVGKNFPDSIREKIVFR